MIEFFEKNFKSIIGCIIGALVGVVTFLMPSPLFEKGRYVPDNELEQKVEKFIEKKTGITVDFSPESADEDQKKDAGKHGH